MGRRISVRQIEEIASERNAHVLLQQEWDAARGDISRRCLECAIKHVPEGAIVIKWRKSLTGKALHRGTLLAMETPVPKTRKALYVFLHECAHLHLHRKTSKPKHRREYEAEMFAHEKMQEAGIPVPEQMTQSARKYVAWKISQAVKRGALRIDEDAFRFAGE